MTRVSVAALVCMAVVLCVGAGGCKQEPTIVIKFDAVDMAGAHKLVDMSLAAPDLATLAPPDLAPAASTHQGPPECKKASDCQAVPVDCCPCSEGGHVHAVAKKGPSAVAEAARVKRCKGTMCPMHISNDPSCSAQVDCVQGACVLVPRQPTR